MVEIICIINRESEGASGGDSVGGGVGVITV